MRALLPDSAFERSVNTCCFDSAIVRQPATTVSAGLRAHDRGDPTYQGICAEHEAYVGALRTAGLKVHVLPALEAFPDSVFVEDPALVFSAGAVVLRPGAASRKGEAEALRPALEQHFERVLQLARGSVDGGDVLVLPDTVMIGLSARTTREGAEALIECLAALGRTGVVVQTPRDVLHLKSDCSLLDAETILTTSRLSRSRIFSGFKELIVPEGEEAGANALRVNDQVLVGQDYPGTLERLVSAGFRAVPLPTSEIARIDAGLSCMSLRWQARRATPERERTGSANS
jgi:dimethylargininase